MGVKKEAVPVPKSQEKVLTYWVVFKGKERDTDRRYFVSNNYEGWYCTGPPVLRVSSKPHSAKRYDTEQAALKEVNAEWEIGSEGLPSLNAAGFDSICEVTRTTRLETSA
jgi:hypothetical protein